LFGRQIGRREYSTDTVLSFSHLASGTYYLLFRVKGQGQVRRRIFVPEPAALRPGTIEQVRALTGETAKDASLLVRPEGGCPPYEYQWGPEAGNQRTALAEKLIGGVQRCLITDSRHCGPVQAVFFLSPLEKGNATLEKSKRKK
jgi:hypothetical protein